MRVPAKGVVGLFVHSHSHCGASAQRQELNAQRMIGGHWTSSIHVESKSIFAFEADPKRAAAARAQSDRLIARAFSLSQNDRQAPAPKDTLCDDRLSP